MNYDVLIVGTGIAGLYTALNLRDDIRILMITKNTFRDCNSYLAQGGISTSLGIFDEESYFNDTMKAGNYHNDTNAVKLLIKNSIKNINTLIKMGVPFDRIESKLRYTREGGHSNFRIVHVKDETGKWVTETLLNIANNKKNITMLENTTLIDLISKDNICYGGVLKDYTKTYKVNSKFTILATGGNAMVKAAYSSGRPALGVGAGNTPAIIDESAHIKMAVNSILLSKTFDNGVICASEQSIIVLEEVYDEVKRELAERGAYILKGEEIDKVRKIILNEKGGLNADMVGQSACKIAKMAGVNVPETAKVLVGEVTSVIFKGMHYEVAVESGKYEMIIRTTRCYHVGDTVGMQLEPDGIHVMLAEDHTTSFVTTINGDYTLDFNGKIISCDLTQVIPKTKMSDGVLVDENGENVDVSKFRVVVSIQPDDIEMSDDVTAGLVSGKIINLIYKGDHYSYVIRTEYGHDLIVDDEYLWNMDDHVGLIMPEEKMKFQLKK